MAPILRKLLRNSRTYIRNYRKQSIPFKKISKLWTYCSVWKWQCVQTCVLWL